MDYENRPCPKCGENLLIYHQYQADARCEGCGSWEEDALAERKQLQAELVQQQAQLEFEL